MLYNDLDPFFLEPVIFLEKSCRVCGTTYGAGGPASVVTPMASQYDS